MSRTFFYFYIFSIGIVKAKNTTAKSILAVVFFYISLIDL